MMVTATCLDRLGAAMAAVMMVVAAERAVAARRKRHFNAHFNSHRRGGDDADAEACREVCERLRRRLVADAAMASAASLLLPEAASGIVSVASTLTLPAVSTTSSMQLGS